MSSTKPLKNPCNYSFKDLIEACGVEVDLNDLYGMLQEDRNTVVKEMCTLAHWHWEDIKGDDGIVYTAFSPMRE
jgi:hypothetical protein